MLKKLNERSRLNREKKKVSNRSLKQHPDFDAGKEVSTIEITNSVVVFDEILEKKQTDTSPFFTWCRHERKDV